MPERTGRTVLLTGMSGTGKSTVVAGLRARGIRAVDADDERLVRERPDRTELRVDLLTELVTGAREPFVLAACGDGQGALHPLVDHVVLLSAPWPVLEHRLQTRAGNPFGRTARQRERIRADLAEVEPLLRRAADTEIVTTLPVEQVVSQVAGLALGRSGQP